jgi:adenylylsulfate kinase
METQARSFAKAVTYRCLGSALTGMIVFLFSRDAAFSVGAGVLDMFSKILLYFLHERLWERIPYGRTKAPEYEI